MVKGGTVTWKTENQHTIVDVITCTATSVYQNVVIEEGSFIYIFFFINLDVSVLLAKNI